MTIVTINEKYRVNVDAWNHTLEVYNDGGFEITFGKGKGTLSQPKWEVEGFYPNLSQCLRRVKQLMALTVPDCSIESYLIELSRLNDEVVLPKP
jgi:hypothetical protein